MVERLRERRVSMRIAGLAGERSVADPLCTEAADELTALTAKVALLTEALKQHEKLLCINSVRDAARQTAPLWLEAADAAARRARSEPDKEGMR